MIKIQLQCVVAIALAAFMFTIITGCKAPGTPVPVYASPAALNIMRGVASIATLTTTRKVPDSIPYFQATAVTLGLLVNSGSADPVLVSQSIDGVKINEIHDPVVKEAIQMALDIYQLQWGEAVKSGIDANTYCIPVLSALRTGILAGLDLTEAKAALSIQIQK